MEEPPLGWSSLEAQERRGQDFGSESLEESGTGPAEEGDRCTLRYVLLLCVISGDDSAGEGETPLGPLDQERRWAHGEEFLGWSLEEGPDEDVQDARRVPNWNVPVCFWSACPKVEADWSEDEEDDQEVSGKEEVKVSRSEDLRLTPVLRVSDVRLRCFLWIRLALRF